MGSIDKRHCDNDATVNIFDIISYISVEVKARYIQLPTIAAINFKMYWRTFDAPHILAAFACTHLHGLNPVAKGGS